MTGVSKSTELVRAFLHSVLLEHELGNDPCNLFPISGAKILKICTIFLFLSACVPVHAQDENSIAQNWNIHGQVTETPQGTLGFPALYSGPNSLNSKGEVQETFTADLYAGARLWRGGEIHADGLLWKGFRLSNDKGIEAFPNGDAFKLGIKTPHFMFAHLFIRET